MNPLSRFRHWLAGPLLERMREECGLESLGRQKAAYDLGVAHGEFRGQQMLLSELGRMVEERRSPIPEVTAADLERAKKGMVH